MTRVRPGFSTVFSAPGPQAEKRPTRPGTIAGPRPHVGGQAGHPGAIIRKRPCTCRFPHQNRPAAGGISANNKPARVITSRFYLIPTKWNPSLFNFYGFSSKPLVDSPCLPAAPAAGCPVRGLAWQRRRCPPDEHITAPAQVPLYPPAADPRPGLFSRSLHLCQPSPVTAVFLSSISGTSFFFPLIV